MLAKNCVAPAWTAPSAGWVVSVTVCCQHGCCNSTICRWELHVPHRISTSPVDGRWLISVCSMGVLGTAWDFEIGARGWLHGGASGFYYFYWLWWGCCHEHACSHAALMAAVEAGAALVGGLTDMLCLCYIWFAVMLCLTPAASVCCRAGWCMCLFCFACGTDSLTLMTVSQSRQRVASARRLLLCPFVCSARAASAMLG